MSVVTPAGSFRRSWVIDLEYCYTIVALLLLTNSFTPIFYDLVGEHSDSYTDSNPLKLATTIAIYLVAITIVLLHTGPALRVALANPLVIAIFVLPVVTILWSVDKDTTLKRSLAHLLTGVFCVYVAARIPPDELLRRLVIVFFIGGLATFAYVAVFPYYGIHGGANIGGSWKGIYGHKNELGRVAVIALISAGYAASRTRMQQVLRISTLVMFLLLLALSQSRTNWLIVFGIVCMLPLFRLLHVRRLSLALRLSPIILIAVSLCTVVALGHDELLAAVGRDATLSGRESLWHGVIAVTAAKYAILGAGYGAFFTPQGGLAELAPYISYWAGIPNHAHSGLLNTWANLGLPGVFLALTLLVVLSVRLLRRLILDPRQKLWAAFTCLLFLFIVNNVSESVAFTHSDIAWVLINVVFCYVGMDEARRRAINTSVRLGGQTNDIASRRQRHSAQNSDVTRT